MLTFSLWLPWFSWYVNSIFHKSLNADILCESPGLGCTWIWFFTSHWMLTFSSWLSWLRKYVNSIFHKPQNANILPVVVLAKIVCEFYFSQATECWDSPRGLPGSVGTWIWSFTNRQTLTFSRWLSWPSWYVNFIFHKPLKMILLPWLSWFSWYANLNFHKPPNADILAAVVLT